MSLLKEDLRAVDNHWAVLAVGEENRDYGLKIVNSRLVTKAVGREMNLSLEPSEEDDRLLKRLLMAYEIAAVEGLSEFLSISSENQNLKTQCIAGAWRAFEIKRLFEVPQDTNKRIYHVLHLSALAYCGDRWSDIQRWYTENQDFISTPSVADQSWDNRLLYRLYSCWIRLIRKKGWDDLDRIREIIAGLREDQEEFESKSLGKESGNEKMALRLIALYNWAKSTELLAKFILQGEPRAINPLLDKHFEAAINAAIAGGDAQLEILMRWLHAAGRQMVSGSLWRVAHSINSRVTSFVASTTKKQSMFELLPPQRAALQEQGLLDQAATAVVIDLPTSGGKTLLAQFRILQALNQFDRQSGWVAYVVPTRALSSQITRRLRRDFSPIGVKVEQLTGAIEIDAIEEEMLSSENISDERTFDILVATPEKLQLIIRNKKINRPLALVVMDEAHNIESESRGMRIELLLATIKQESNEANFLLLMPFVDKVDQLARWLASDTNSGRAISLGTSVWKPNDRVVGMYKAVIDDSQRAGWKLKFKTLTTTPNSIHLSGTHDVGETRPIDVPKSRVIDSNGNQKGFALQTAAISTVFSKRGTSIAVGDSIRSVWSMARKSTDELPKFDEISSRIKLVQKFLKAEISPNFELIEMLSHGVAVHHSGLSDEVRALIEWLAEENELNVLCATTTIAQGINFPVSSVFLASKNYRLSAYPYMQEMPPRDFWNLAGRAGRMNQDSVGVIGLAEANRTEEIANYLNRATGELVSRLVAVVESLDEAQTTEELIAVIQQDQWEDFRCYVNHLVNEMDNIETVINNAELSLRNTYGYRILQDSPEGQSRAQKLLEATKQYAHKISTNPGQVAMADMTGFSFEGVGKALSGLNSLENKLTIDDFSTDNLFGDSKGIADLYGVMLRVPQLARNLDDLRTSGETYTQLASITNDWVSGRSIQDIAATYFQSDDNDITSSITDACRAIYRNLTNNGTWGLSAISRISGINFEELTDEEKRKIDLLPAMIYHGVKTEEGVLMRMNGVPRSVAEKLGEDFKDYIDSENTGTSIQIARTFLESSDQSIWDNAKPENSPLSGEEYKKVWKVISGETN